MQPHGPPAPAGDQGRRALGERPARRLRLHGLLLSRSRAAPRVQLQLSEPLLDALLGAALARRPALAGLEKRLELPGLPVRWARIRLGSPRARLRLRRADAGRLRLETQLDGEVQWGLPLGRWSQQLELAADLLLPAHLASAGPPGVALRIDLPAARIARLEAKVRDLVPWPGSWGADWWEEMRRPLTREVAEQALSWGLRRGGPRSIDLGRTTSHWLGSLGLGADQLRLDVEDGQARIRTDTVAEPIGALPDPRTLAIAEVGPEALAPLAQQLADQLRRRWPYVELQRPALLLEDEHLRLEVDLRWRRLPAVRARLRARIELEGDAVHIRPASLGIAVPPRLERWAGPVERQLARALRGGWQLQRSLALDVGGTAGALELRVERVALCTDVAQVHVNGRFSAMPSLTAQRRSH